VALSDIDRKLLDRCLERRPRSWEDFVDRFMGLVIHVINHTAQSRSIELSVEDRDDLASEVFLAIIKDDLAVLRRFRGSSSLATYLTIVARRVVARQLLHRRFATSLNDADRVADTHSENGVEQRIDDDEQVRMLLAQLDGQEAQVVRMYHLEGLSYREISTATGVPENTIGPVLSRARGKMRRADQTAH